ncbi:hypothetical protein AMAG_00115 [Allomyces macrogynus ATCC 38327]|uniref:RNA helicase n=1 Tax=Allomyces macrogynus (strain ATCC 38327) TaxID=578462 RepID=A0A0L0RUP1_ALLM3|nr:hypothetical protein AMAG_00115 [Allomyces macrogynus ATCC 38327]|eukprot:KNE54112.1 hypothetical protein AMAG_00115 [Allomyces macrogynus ATCC 38327]
MDIFRSLTGGARFDKKRFLNDVQVFEAKDDAAASANVGTVATALKALDFFGTSTSGTSSSSTTAPSAAAATTTDDLDADPSVEPFANDTAVQDFRRSHRIKVDGVDVPAPIQSFRDLRDTYTIRDRVARNVRAAGYVTPTPIQMQAIPLILRGRDVLACAPTGSGKTLAYVLPIVHQLVEPSKEGVRALIVAPTRELVLQIEREVGKLVGKKWRVHVLTKATPIDRMPKCDILISTPMRLVQAIQAGAVQLNRVKHLVLDEADKLLELGFLEQVDEILAACPTTQRQTSLFSATLASAVEQLAKTVMRDDVVRVIIGLKNTATSTITQSLVFTGDESGKLMTIRQHLKTGELHPPVLIFVQSIDRAKELFRELVYDGMNVDVIHADRTKQQRDKIIDQFRLGHLWILIATDVLARGIDMVVQTVINYDFPTSVEAYIHRIGRTGRAGRPGRAITYFTRDDAPHLRSIVNVMKESGCDVPEWMLSLKKASQNERKKLKKSAPKRATISTMSKYDANKVKRKRDMIDASKRRKLKAEGKVPTGPAEEERPAKKSKSGGDSEDADRPVKKRKKGADEAADGAEAGKKKGKGKGAAPPAKKAKKVKGGEGASA